MFRRLLVNLILVGTMRFQLLPAGLELTQACPLDSNFSGGLSPVSNWSKTPSKFDDSQHQRTSFPAACCRHQPSNLRASRLQSSANVLHTKIMDRNRNSDPKSTLRKSTVSNGSAWNDAVCDKDQNPDRPPEMVGKLHAKAVVFSPRSTIQNGPGQPRSLEIRRAGWRTEGGGFSRMPRALTCLTLLELWRI
jgi:hypothetical protein